MRQLCSRYLYCVVVATTMFPAVAYAVEPGDTELLPMSLKVLAALAVVLGIMLLLYAGVKKSGRWIRTGKDSEIKLVEVRYLAPKKALYLIEVHGSRLLLSGTTGRLETLARWETGKPGQLKAADEPGVTFAAELEQQLGVDQKQDGQ